MVILCASMRVMAVPGFQTGEKYRIVCQQFTAGCVVDGAAAGQQTPLYYRTTATTQQSAYWLMEDCGDSQFYIRNAQTGQYVTYDGVREGSTAAMSA